MKRIYRYILICAAAFAAMSCSLKEDAKSFVSPDDFYSTLEECQAGVIGCYRPLNTIFGKDFMIAVEGTTDLMYASGSGTQDAHLDISPATARFGVTMWSQAYVGVRNTNMCIAGMEQSGLDAEKIAPLIAEAKTLRAFYYYLLTSLFGDVPFYKDVIRTKDDLDRIQKLPRMSADSTRADLVSELQECVGDMPAGRAYDVASQHVGSAFCHILIAKLAMWNKDWQSALESLLQLKDWYGDLYSDGAQDAYPISDIQFSVSNTPESIFEIQHTYTAGGLDVGTTLASYMTPSRGETVIDSVLRKDVYDGVCIPALGELSSTYTAMRPTKYFYQSLMTKDGEDRRAEYYIAWGWENHKGEWQAFNSTRPWMGPKFWCWGMVTANDANNYPVFRYADAVLMLAEVYNEMDNPTEAMACLNQVKNRAGIAEYTTFKTKAGLLDEIQRERARELVGEWQRKFDLVRWGIWYKQVWNNSDYSTLLKNILPCHEYYPIPDSECGLSGGALTNEAYDKYLGAK